MATLTQLPDVVDLAFVAGDTFRIRVRVVAPNAAEPEPLEEYVFCAQISQTGERVIVAEFEVSPDADSPLDSVELRLDPDDTDALPSLGDGKEFKGVWDLEVTFPVRPGQALPDVRTVVKGSVTCVVDVSRLGP